MVCQPLWRGEKKSPIKRPFFFCRKSRGGLQVQKTCSCCQLCACPRTRRVVGANRCEQAPPRVNSRQQVQTGANRCEQVLTDVSRCPTLSIKIAEEIIKLKCEWLGLPLARLLFTFPKITCSPRCYTSSSSPRKTESDIWENLAKTLTLMSICLKCLQYQYNRNFLSWKVVLKNCVFPC